MQAKSNNYKIVTLTQIFVFRDLLTSVAVLDALTSYYKSIVTLCTQHRALILCEDSSSLTVYISICI